jgi:hypothetical protein
MPDRHSHSLAARARLELVTAPGVPERHAAAQTDSTDQREWQDLVAREAMHQEVIDASFERAEAYERLGDFKHATEWLNHAAALAGGLPPAFRTKCARWARATPTWRSGLHPG